MENDQLIREFCEANMREAMRIFEEQIRFTKMWIIAFNDPSKLPEKNLEEANKAVQGGWTPEALNYSCQPK